MSKKIDVLKFVTGQKATREGVLTKYELIPLDKISKILLTDLDGSESVRVVSEGSTFEIANKEDIKAFLSNLNVDLVNKVDAKEKTELVKKRMKDAEDRTKAAEKAQKEREAAERKAADEKAAEIEKLKRAAEAAKKKAAREEAAKQKAEEDAKKKEAEDAKKVVDELAEEKEPVKEEVVVASVATKKKTKKKKKKTKKK